MVKSISKFSFLTLGTSFGIIPFLQSQEVVREYLPGTRQLTIAEVENLRPQMIEGMHKYFTNEMKSSLNNRELYWQRDYSSFAGYNKSVASNRVRLRKIIGVVDERKVVQELILNESTEQKSLIVETDAYKVYNVSWQVLEGVTGTGLWI